MTGLRRWMVTALILAICLSLANCSSGRSWRTASRDSVGIAPPATKPEAVLHVYGAKAWGWRGWLAIHTWVAAKRSDETAYTVYEVIGWRGRHGRPVLRIAKDLPDRRWFGEEPRLLKAFQGEGVDSLIDAVDDAARRYPWPHRYRVFPGPNSNTFTGWIAREVPQLELELPFTAIGSSYAWWAAPQEEPGLSPAKAARGM